MLDVETVKIKNPTQLSLATKGSVEIEIWISRRPFMRKKNGNINMEKGLYNYI